MPATLSVAVVSFAPDLELLQRTLRSLATSLDEAYAAGALGKATLLIMDNGPGDAWTARLRELSTEAVAGRPFLLGGVMTGHGNLGYGRANNLGLLDSGDDYLLVLNPDVIVETSTIAKAIGFMDAHPEIGLLAPMTVGEEGERQFLCKRFPTLLDLALRGFAPARIKRMFATRLARYEMRDVPDTQPCFGIPIVSGCFMFFRGAVFRNLRGFDPAFFMYFEDFDLSLRAGKLAGIAFVPDVRVVHYGGHASRKGWRHIRMFVRSAATFFGKHGWRWA
jgi:GT2 family glycosyltransferase